MKLLNYTTAYFAGILLIVISIWSAVFYYSMLDEIYDSIDDGLDNQKGLVIHKASVDPSVLGKRNFDESDYTIREISPGDAISRFDIYVDTMMYMQNEKSDEPVRLLKTVFFQNGKYYQLQIATSMVEEDDLIKQLFLSVVWLYLGLVVTILLFNNFLLKRIWKPFYHLLRNLRNFRLDEPKPIRPTATNVAEFRLLNETIEKLLQRNQDIYNSQKNFIENASHELQTPLAISINKLEALAENNELPPAQLQVLSDALDNLERLTRLNKSLLLLSKIENQQFEINSSVNLNQIVRDVVRDFADQTTYDQIDISLKEKAQCNITMNADLAVVLIVNLIKNAIIHNVPSGKVDIIIDSRMLRIENTGDPATLNEEKIFNRFHTGKPSQTSTGLGLAIVKAIVTLYHFKATYRHNERHIIEVQFA